jgi:hypothetical protein
MVTNKLKRLQDDLYLRSPEMKTHPVLIEMSRLFSRDSVASEDGVIERAVLLQGRPYSGVPRPKGYRGGSLKECFANADELAFKGKGVYVEGLVLRPESPRLIHHGWITTDGTDAIEVTWREQADVCHYFGIPFSFSVRRRWLKRLGYWGFLNIDPELLDELLKDILDEPPSYGGVPIKRHTGSRIKARKQHSKNAR